MKKFSNIKLEKNDSELEIGIKIESEHCDVYEFIKDYLDGKDVKMPLSKKEFYEKIAKSHIKEIPDYYTRLVKMEKEK